MRSVWGRGLCCLEHQSLIKAFRLNPTCKCVNKQKIWYVTPPGTIRTQQLVIDIMLSRMTLVGWVLLFDVSNVSKNSFCTSERSVDVTSVKTVLARRFQVDIRLLHPLLFFLVFQLRELLSARRHHTTVEIANHLALTLYVSTKSNAKINILSKYAFAWRVEIFIHPSSQWACGLARRQPYPRKKTCQI